MKRIRCILIEASAVLLSLVIFGVPFLFVLLTSFKDKMEAGEMNMSLPQSLHIAENYLTVLQTKHGMIIRGFYNSALITFFSLAIMIIVCSMAAFVLQRRKGKLVTIINLLFMLGLMMPPAIVPTIWVLSGLGLFKTLIGIILVEVALFTPFSIMVYKGYIATIPKELDEAALMDGCGRMRFFINIIFPLLKPVTSTVIILVSVNIFNDFVNPLYFFPGAKNVTVQTSIYNFMGQYASSWNLVFADVVLITIPPLILFLIFNKKIIGGMTSGAVKG
ncbi:carbohydrate ABC transporter permease [Robinsoniella peoriensis]